MPQGLMSGMSFSQGAMPNMSQVQMPQFSPNQMSMSQVQGQMALPQGPIMPGQGQPQSYSTASGQNYDNRLVFTSHPYYDSKSLGASHS